MDNCWCGSCQEDRDRHARRLANAVGVQYTGEMTDSLVFGAIKAALDKNQVSTKEWLRCPHSWICAYQNWAQNQEEFDRGLQEMQETKAQSWR
jgi:hypothetical protein